MKRIQETPQYLSLELFDCFNDLWKYSEDVTNYSEAGYRQTQ